MEVCQIIGGTQIDNRIKKHHILVFKFENTRNLNFFTKIYHFLPYLTKFYLFYLRFFLFYVILRKKGKILNLKLINADFFNFYPNLPKNAKKRRNGPFDDHLN
jgi:hypothetical protein